MMNQHLNFAPFNDLELLDKAIFYLFILYPSLPHTRLKHHCNGAMASLYELYFYLVSHHLKDYGNNE